MNLINQTVGRTRSIIVILTSFVFCGCSHGFQTVKLPSIAIGSAALSSAAPNAVATTPGYDIIVIAGQSNAVGFGCGTHIDVSTSYDNRIFQVDPSNHIIPATDPLFFSIGHANLIGFGLTFARLYAQQLPAGRNVLIVPAALGGTSIWQWDTLNENISFNGATDSTKLWDAMVSRTSTALAYQGTNNRIVGLLWHQGENDYATIEGAVAPYNGIHMWVPTVAAYQERLKGFFSLFRATFGGTVNVPIIAGEIGSFWSANAGPDTNGVLLTQFNQGIGGVMAGFSNAGFVSAAGLISDAIDGCSTDTAHFSASSQIEFGKRYFTEFQSLQALSSPTLTTTYDPNLPGGCNIAGGDGAPLYSGQLTRDQCSAQCTASISAHPNALCLWQNIDLAPIASCTISGGVGASLFYGTVSHGDCYNQCLVQKAPHPNLSCIYQGVDLAPQGTCSIVGGAGAQLFSGIRTQGQCYNTCNSMLSAHPNESCQWNGVTI